MPTDRDKLDRLVERVRGALDKINFDPRPPFQISESGTVEPVDHDTADAIRFILGASRSLLALVEAGRELEAQGDECSGFGSVRCRFCRGVKSRLDGTINHVESCPRHAYDAAVREIREP